MALAFIFGVNKDVIQINNDEDIEFLGQDLIDVALEAGRSIRQSKRHHLVLKVAVLSLESCFLFIAFSYLHSVVGVGQVQLGELLGPTQSI